jgi:5-methylcytosine-specific restriction endonuclease McrA
MKCMNCDNEVITDCINVLCQDCKDKHRAEVESKKKFIKRPISAKLRWEVWERDNFTCLKCGARKNLAVDHIHPESRGGIDSVENFQTLCKSCNSKKGDR